MQTSADLRCPPRYRNVLASLLYDQLLDISGCMLRMRSVRKRHRTQAVPQVNGLLLHMNVRASQDFISCRLFRKTHKRLVDVRRSLSTIADVEEGYAAAGRKRFSTQHKCND